MIRSIFRLALFGCLAAPGAHALDWQNTSVAVTAKPGADVVLTSFKFTNSGKSMVHVLGVTTSCGCTDATANPNDIPPGQSGAIEVLFTIGKRQGLQERDVLVQTSDAETPTKLTLRVTIPEPAPKVATTTAAAK